MVDHITEACREAGSYTLSIGTMEPSLVVKRLLAALAVLDPEAHGEITGTDGEYAAIPPDALCDGSSGWWDSEQGGGAFIQNLIGAINRAAPKGFACSWSDMDRLELIPFDPPPAESVGLDSPAPAPHVSAVRTRVNPRSR